MSVVIYHNPRCSKSRQTLELLKQNNVEPVVVEYLKTPLNKEQIVSLLTKLNLTVTDIMRSKESEYKELGLHNEDVTDQQRLDAIVSTPKLLERPIVVNGDRAAIGRPPENVLAIL